ncbi:Guanosine-5'-triphosphate,3'-diphosphate pyrophosphatase [Pseudoalteromonas holothuriae]|uniref:Guanosine-5'-triphosphate,3'-diphosphate pyrophosphatase n=1 Tax=Pseudoalteromonas holothuriae TaxID=2963714 RepID=A0ABN8UR01_9GAMM|nr:guanosine-5'-triphosphate,3'-diphosphate diphosphatase [Pseudoalteromonas sp. CIP111951]CAH9067294.1 Guanosine-5'-triphosphate,3'-diphosphate pyrophosphatase [Pseudoalteromonas sp. CIP111951]
MTQKIPHSDVFAVIDLGSNSFHMLIARHVAGGVHTIGRVKRKVRLAAGLDRNNVLSDEAMQRGWECLALFAERLQDIPKQNISIVATATLRLAKNADEFKSRAEQILQNKVNVISGELEAKTIYKGVAHTSACLGRQLVIDIGGASTEVVIGKGFHALLYKSLNMGCVTYLERFFCDGLLSKKNFTEAISAATSVIKPIQKDYIDMGWELAIGASGTVQAIQEILAACGHSDMLTLQKLEEIQIQAMACQSIKQLDLPGLGEERRLVFVSGLAILIALFKSLKISQMGLAGGALREGVLYSMIPELHNSDICKRTLDSFMDRYHVDKQQASYVTELSLSLAKQLCDDWQLDIDIAKKILSAVASVHEIGLIVDYKLYHQHSAYILSHTCMPGYSKIEKQLIVALTASHRTDINIKQFNNLSAKGTLAKRLSRIIRIAVILSMRRQDDIVPPVRIVSDESDFLTISFEADWLINHPLMESELEQEAQYQRRVGWDIQIKRD